MGTFKDRYDVGDILPFGWRGDDGKPFNPYDYSYMNRSKRRYDLPDATDAMLA